VVVEVGVGVVVVVKVSVNCVIVGWHGGHARVKGKQAAAESKPKSRPGSG